VLGGVDQCDVIVALRATVYGGELGYGAEAFDWGPMDDRAFHLLALDEKESAVAAMRLLGPEARPFELETSVALEPHLRTGHRPGEITRFCIAQEFRPITRGLPVHTGMIRLLHDTCRQHRIDDVFICAKRGAQRLYEFALYETLAAPEIPYAPLGGEAHVLMRLHIPTLVTRYRAVNHPLRRAFEPQAVDAQRGDS